MKDLILILIGYGCGILATLMWMDYNQHGFYDGYKQAYIESKKGAMETYVKEHYPRLWIEYNTPEREKGR
jgi:hypothetical protein